MKWNVEAKGMSSREIKYGRGGSDEPLRGTLDVGVIISSISLIGGVKESSERFSGSLWGKEPSRYKLLCMSHKCFCCPSSCQPKDKEARRSHDTYWLCHKPPQQLLSLGCNWGWGCGSVPARLYPRAAAGSVAHREMNVECLDISWPKGWKENNNLK